MTNIFRSLSFAIVQAIYPLIPDLYGVVMDLASNKYFTTESIRTLSGNIYIIISACMLFALALKLISAIVNPDMLSDKKKGVRSVALHIIFAVFLIVLVPIAFDKMYEFQDDIVENQLVEKIILGMDTDESNEPGQILAAYAFASFCEPHETVSAQALSSQGADLYNKALTDDIDYIKQMDGVINSKTNGEYDLEYNAILSPAVGLYLVYQLILMAMDMALRTIKLGMLQLITPVILCGYVIAGTDILQKWAKMVASTFALLFLKIAMISFMIYGLSLLPDFLDNFSSKSFWYRGFLRVFMIIGLLQLIKQIPDIINGIFGTNIKSRGGIRGRLGEMAAVGELAQRGWDQLRQHPLQTAARLASAPISAVGGFATHIAAAGHAAIDRGRAQAEQIRQAGGRAPVLRGMLTGAAQAGAGILTAGGAAWRAGRQGLQNGNIRAIGETRQRYMDTHPGDSTFFGRLGDTITEGAGYGTRKSRQEEADKYIDYTDRQGNTRRVTFEELQARQAIEKSFDEGRSAIRSQIETSIDREASFVMMDDGTGGGGITVTAGGRSMTLTGNAASIRQQIESLSNASAAELGVADAQAKAELIAALNHQFDETRNNILDASENAVWNGGANATYNGQQILRTGADRAIVDNALDHITDLVADNADLRRDMTTEINGHTSAIAFGHNQNGETQIRVSDFRNGARDSVTQDYNNINRDVTEHDEAIAARPTTAEGRHIQADHNAVNARNNNGGNNNGGGNNH